MIERAHLACRGCGKRITVPRYLEPPVAECWECLCVTAEEAAGYMAEGREHRRAGSNAACCFCRSL